MKRRYSCALVSLVWLVAGDFVKPCLGEMETELLFAEGLRSRGYYDLAERHLDDLLAGRLTQKEKAAVRYVSADLHQEMADRVVSKSGPPMQKRLELKEIYLSQAEENFRTALKLDPYNERSAEARFSVGTISKQRALTKKREWEKLEDELRRLGASPTATDLSEDDKKKEARRKEIRTLVPKVKKEAEELLTESVKHFTAMAGVREKEFKDFEKKAKEATKKEAIEKWDKKAEDAKIDWARAEFEWYSNLIHMAEIVGAKTPAGKKNLESAVAKLKELGFRYSSWLIGKYAIMLEGHGRCLLEDYAAGFKKFEELLDEKIIDALRDVIKKSHYQMAKAALDADPQKYPKERPNQFALAVWILEGMDYKATWDDEKNQRGLKEIGAQFGRRADDLRKISGKDTYVVKTNEKVTIYQGVFRRFEAIEREDIGKAMTLLLAEAYVKWGLALEGQKPPAKGWVSKCQAGFAYAEKIAEGQDAWTFAANSLLAEWAPLMKRIRYVSPVQLYARGTDAFVVAAKTMQQDKKRALYNDCIYYLQKVIEFCESKAGGAKHVFPQAKIVDAWHKMGSAYYLTDRMLESALTWNALSRKFPDDAQAQKAGSLSTVVMGKVYRATGKDLRPTVGHFYGDILGDFVKLAPDHEKAPDCQFFIGEVARGRKDYLQAAEEYRKVPAVSRYYSQALFLVGVCYLNEFYRRYTEGQGETPEAKALLEKADLGLVEYIGWVEETETANEEEALKRRQSQAKAYYNRASVYLFPVMNAPDKAISITEGFVEKFSSYLPQESQDKYFPQMIFARLKAFVMKDDLDGANEELTRLLKYPKSNDLANGFKYVAGVYLKGADEIAAPGEDLKKQAEEKKAEAQKLREVKKGEEARKGEQAKKEEEAEKLEKEAADLIAEAAVFDEKAGPLRIKAADLYHRLLAKVPDQDSSIYLFTADTYFVNKVYDKGAMLYAHFLTRFSEKAEFKGRLTDVKARAGECHYHLKECQKAVGLLAPVEEAYKAKNDNRRYLLKPMLAHCYKALGMGMVADPQKREAAMAAYASALKHWAALKNSYQAGAPEWWEPVYEIAAILYLMGDHEKSQKVLVSTALMYPKMGGAEWQLRFTELLKKLRPRFKKQPAGLQKIDDLIKKLSKRA